MTRWYVVRINPETKERIPLPASYSDRKYAEDLAKAFNYCWKHPETGLVFKLEVESREA